MGKQHEGQAGYPGSINDGEGKIADIKHNGHILLAPSVAQSSRRSESGAYEIVDDRAPVPAPDWLARQRPRKTSSDLPDDPFESMAHDVREMRRKETDDHLVKLLQRKRNTLSRDNWLRLGFAIHAGFVDTQWENEACAAFLDFSERWEAPRGHAPVRFSRWRWHSPMRLRHRARPYVGTVNKSLLRTLRPTASAR